MQVSMHSFYREFSKIVMLDLDTFMVQHMDELFALNADAITPEAEGDRGLGVKMFAVNSGTMFLVPKPSTERAMIEVVKTTIWPAGHGRLSDQDYLELLLVTPENSTGRPRVPAVVLAPQYNMNSALCNNVLLVRNWHCHHHKPWRVEHRQPTTPCVVAIIDAWLARYQVLRGILDGLAIPEPPFRVVNLTWEHQNQGH